MTFDFNGRSLNRRTGETEHWTFDLNSLGTGDAKAGVTARPALAKRLFPAFCELFSSGARSTAYRSRYNLIYFWRFLDDQQKLSAVLDPQAPAKICDLTWVELEAIWRHFLDWLRAKPEAEMNIRTKYYINTTVVQVSRRRIR